MPLAHIRNLIAKRNIPPELVGKIEVLCIEVYEYALARYSKKPAVIDATVSVTVMSVEETKALHASMPGAVRTLKSPLSRALWALDPGESFSLRCVDYEGLHSDFYSYAHNIARCQNKKVSVRSDGKGSWIITRIA